MFEFNNTDQNMKTPYSLEFTSQFETFSPPLDLPSIVSKKKNYSVNGTVSFKESQNIDFEKVREELSSPIAFMNHRPSMEYNSKRIRHRRIGSDTNSSLNDRSINIPRESWSSKKNVESGVYGTRFKYIRGDKLNTSDSPKRSENERNSSQRCQQKGKNALGNENLFFNSIIKELKTQSKFNYTRIIEKKVIEQVKDMELLNSPTINYVKPRLQSPQVGSFTLSPPMKPSQPVREISLLSIRPLNQNSKPKYHIPASVPYTRTTTPKQPLRPRIQSEAKSIVCQDKPEKGKIVGVSQVIYCDTPKNDISTIRARRNSKATKVSKSFHSIDESNLSIKPRDRSFSKDEVSRRQKSILINPRKVATAQSQNDLENIREKKPFSAKNISILNENRPKKMMNPMGPLVSPDGKSNLLRKVSPSRAEKRLELKRLEELINQKREEARIKKLEQDKKYISLLQTHIGPSFERVSEKLKNYQVCFFLILLYLFRN